MSKLLIGIFVMVATLYGGSYVLNEVGFRSWLHFPLFVTFLVVFIIGFGSVGYELSKSDGE